MKASMTALSRPMVKRDAPRSQRVDEQELQVHADAEREQEVRGGQQLEIAVELWTRPSTVVRPGVVTILRPRAGA